VALAFVLGYALTAIVFFPGSSAGPVVTVPDLRGRSLAQARRAANRLELQLERGAALAHPEVPSGAVLAQSPLPGEEVVPGEVIRVILSAGRDRRPIPNVEGLDSARARRLLQETGFQVAVVAREDSRPPGQVLGVRPTVGTSLELPAAVQLVVSSGPAPVPQVSVPSLLDLPEPAARVALQEAGLRLGAVLYDPDSGRPLGGVVAQQPEAGATVPSGSAVRITVSGSPPPAPPPADTASATPAPPQEPFAGTDG
jgi:serine/threonine-protein kinase